MKRLHFLDYEYFVANIVESIESLCDKYESVSIIAKYEETRKLIKELIGFDYDIASINLELKDFDGYCDEYIISVNQNNEIWCEPFKRNDEYFTNVSEVTYILDNCSSSVIKHCESDFIYEVNIGENFDEDDCGVDEISLLFGKHDEKNIHGLTFTRDDDYGSHIYSYYSSASLDKDDILNVLDRFGLRLNR